MCTIDTNMNELILLVYIEGFSFSFVCCSLVVFDMQWLVYIECQMQFTIQRKSTFGNLRQGSNTIVGTLVSNKWGLFETKNPAKMIDVHKHSI